MNAAYTKDWRLEGFEKYKLYCTSCERGGTLVEMIERKEIEEEKIAMGLDPDAIYISS